MASPHESTRRDFLKVSAGVVSLAALAPSLGYAETAEGEFTHGPILGRPGPDRMSIWARTSRPTSFHVNYGTQPDRLTSRTASVNTAVDHDLSAYVTIDGLQPRTKYYY